MEFYNRHYQQYGVYPTKGQPFRYEVNDIRYEYDLVYVKEKAHAELAKRSPNTTGCMAWNPQSLQTFLVYISPRENPKFV